MANVLGAPSIRMPQKVGASPDAAEPDVEVLEAVAGGIGCPHSVNVLTFEDDERKPSVSSAQLQ